MDRRDFIASLVGGSFVLATTRNAAASPPGPFAQRLTQTFLRIDPDSTVTVFAKHLDMGQGSGRASRRSSPRSWMRRGTRCV